MAVLRYWLMVLLFWFFPLFAGLQCSLCLGGALSNSNCVFCAGRGGQLQEHENHLSTSYTVFLLCSDVIYYLVRCLRWPWEIEEYCVAGQHQTLQRDAWVLHSHWWVPAIVSRRKHNGAQESTVLRKEHMNRMELSEHKIAQWAVVRTVEEEDGIVSSREHMEEKLAHEQKIVHWAERSTWAEGSSVSTR